MKDDNRELPEYKEKQSIDILDEKLYHKDVVREQRKRRKIHEREINLEHDFPDDFDDVLKLRKKRVLPPSLFKKIFFSTLFFFFITAIVAVVSLYKGKKEVSDDLISMEILSQPFVDGGDTLELKVRIQNFNEKELELPDLVLSYPKDSILSGDEVFLRRSLQGIKKGQRVDEEFNINLFGQEGDVRKIKAVLEYRIAGSSSIFVKQAEHEMLIRSTPTQITIKAAKNIVENQELVLDVEVSSNSTKQLNDILLSFDYPLGFEFISSTVEPQFGQHTWYFPSVTNEKQTFQIVGRLGGLPGQGQSFHAKLGKQDALQKNRIETVFNTITHSIDIEKSFILVDMGVNSDTDGSVVIRGGDTVNVKIDYENSLGVTLADIQITADIKGDLYNPDGLFVSRGTFDSNIDRITWNKSTSDRLAFLEPGETGDLSISIPTHKLVSEAGSITNPNFTISINVSATEMNGNVRNATGVASATVSGNSDIRLVSKTLHASGPFKNSGPVPPKVGSDTQYTITLQATNSSNNVEKSQVKTFLPPYVTWLGNIAPSTERQNINYNQTTREVVWDIGILKSGLGVNDTQPKQVSFQVSALPSLQNIGANLNLTNNIILSGKDSFTGTNLSFKQDALSTRLHQDPSAESADGRIVR